jgi:hypothetical protein
VPENNGLRTLSESDETAVTSLANAAARGLSLGSVSARSVVVGGLTPGPHGSDAIDEAVMPAKINQKASGASAVKLLRPIKLTVKL